MSVTSVPATYLTGTVKWFDCKKGFGFIVDRQGQDVFVHYTVIEGDGFRKLDDGATVEYEATPTPRGLAALHVRCVEKPAAASNPQVPLE